MKYEYKMIFSKTTETENGVSQVWAEFPLSDWRFVAFITPNAMLFEKVSAETEIDKASMKSDATH